MADTDPLAAELDEIRGLASFAYPGEWDAAGPRLLAAVDKALALHRCEPWYSAASDCEHPEPEDELSGEHDDWHDNHPNGSGGILVCLLTQVDSLCPECTRLKYDTLAPEGDDFVSAPCATRSAILAALTGEGGSGEQART